MEETTDKNKSEKSVQESKKAIGRGMPLRISFLRVELHRYQISVAALFAFWDFLLHRQS